MDEKTMNADTITIICDNEDCRKKNGSKYVLSMDTLRAAREVKITCKYCGEMQKIILNEDGGIEICCVK
jgi:aspartate carbamoyltransferase regulatory subunit